MVIESRRGCSWPGRPEAGRAPVYHGERRAASRSPPALGSPGARTLGCPRRPAGFPNAAPEEPLPFSAGRSSCHAPKGTPRRRPRSHRAARGTPRRPPRSHRAARGTPRRRPRSHRAARGTPRRRPRSHRAARGTSRRPLRSHRGAKGTPFGKLRMRPPPRGALRGLLSMPGRRKGTLPRRLALSGVPKRGNEARRAFRCPHARTSPHQPGKPGGPGSPFPVLRSRVSWTTGVRGRRSTQEREERGRSPVVLDSTCAS